MSTEKGLNVLSLFDGMSCGRIALERAGIKVDNYYASEIDKYATKVSQYNYPNIIRLGDVTKVKAEDIVSIGLLIGGSPCQGFSFAGRQLNFEDPRSKLFFEYVRLLNEIRKHNPGVKFLLENVNMKQEYLDIISEHLGVKPERINSTIFSAQMRDRWYWTNIPIHDLPEDKGMVIQDILESGFADKDKSFCIDANYFKGGNLKQYFEKSRRQLVCMQSGIAEINGHDILKRTYSILGKCPTLTAVCGGNQEKKITLNEKEWRKLTPIECERLQTVPDNYTSCVSNSQRYKMLGNGWTVDVIAHIFKGLKHKL